LFLKGLEHEKNPCAKHFVGDGSTQKGIAPYECLHRHDLLLQLERHLDARQPHHLITRFLKGRLNFKVKIFQTRVGMIPLFPDAHRFVFVFLQGSLSLIGKALTGSPVLLEQTTRTLSRLQFSLALTW
jgi:hypothetical protein